MAVLTVNEDYGHGDYRHYLYDKVVWLIFAVTLCLGLVVGGFAGHSFGVEAERKAAVKAGAAEWRADVNGRPQFMYKTEPVQLVPVPAH
jgi:hypothetical protein